MRTKALLVAITCAVCVATVAMVRFRASVETREGSLTQDEFGRFNTAVYINGEGPFAFLVDTGAAMSCVSPGLAERLKLSRIPAVKVNVQGTSGTQAGSMYLATSYKSMVFDKSLEPLVGLLNDAAVKDGVVGMNAFSSGRIEMDFRQRRLVIGPSAGLPADFHRLAASRKGTDILVPVTIDGVDAVAIIDTGARRTMGNRALLRRLGLGDNDRRLTPGEPSQGATSQHLPAAVATLRQVTLGEVNFDSPRITFSELDLFARRGLGDTPAILLGMDLLGKLQALAIDYPRSEFQVKP